MTEPELSIIILSYNTKQITLDAIESVEKNYLKEVEEGKFEVIVCDNASTDGSLEAFKEYKKKTKISQRLTYQMACFVFVVLAIHLRFHEFCLKFAGFVDLVNRQWNPLLWFLKKKLFQIFKKKMFSKFSNN